MLLGAPMSDLAFAADPVQSVMTLRAATAEDFQDIATDVKLANGLKFVLQNSSYYVMVKEVPETNYVTLNANNAGPGNASVFEIRNYNNKTFELWVDGKQFVMNGTSAASKAEDAKNKVFVAMKSSNATDKADFTTINTYVVGSAGVNVFSVTVKAQTEKAALTADELNANLSGKGFAFQFPSVVVTPDKNPFGNQMIAIDASKFTSLFTGAPTTGLYFVVADEAGAKLAETVNKENVKAATFVTLNPFANFNITSLNTTAGEGYDFTTVKGDKLAASNVKKDGKIAYANAVYTVSEEDMYNASGEYTIKMSNVQLKDNDASPTVSAIYVGAYALTSGGLKSYITTKDDVKDLSLAQTTGNTYAKASNLLKTNDAAIYTLYFMGTRPENPAEAKTSWYGKYLVSEYGTTTGTTFGAATTAAPADVDVNSAAAQWYVTSVGEKGAVSFKNYETGVEFDCKLYVTDEAGVYETRNISGTPAGAELVRLAPVSKTDAFLELTDAQMRQGADLIFTGSAAVTVENVYMGLEKGKIEDAAKIKPTSDSDASIVWKFEKANTFKNKIEYAYLSGNEVKMKEVDTLAVSTYYLVLNKEDKQYGFYNFALDELKSGESKATVWSQYAFKKNVNGTYTIVALQNKLGAEYAYADIARADALCLYVGDVTTSPAFSTTFVGNDAEYSHVNMGFVDLGESLEAKPRHATLNGEEGAISFKDNKGILEGIIAAEGLTFWLDTADSQADLPTFYISKGIAAAEDDSVETKASAPAVLRNFMYYAADSAYFWNEDKANYDTDKNYYLAGTEDVKAIFRPSALVGVDTIKTSVNEETVLVSKAAKKDVCVAGVENFKFYITKAGNGYVISPSANPSMYLYNLNGKLGFTDDETIALVVTLGAGDPTANESVADAVEGVKVVGGNGYVEIQGAAGKNVVVTNILGKVIANTVLTSDNQTINVPAGIVVVAVEGEEAAKAVVK